MAERIFIADKETLDAVKADTTGILKQLQDADGKFSNIKRYGVKINKNDSNPDTRVTYLYDAADKNPAKMNYSSSAFDFGDWGDVFFVKDTFQAGLKPCLNSKTIKEVKIPAFQLDPVCCRKTPLCFSML